MDREKDKNYYLEKVINDLSFTINNTKNINYEEFCQNELLNNAISFKLIQISENTKKLQSTIDYNISIPWNKMSGLRNRIVHDYGNIQLQIVYDTVINDLPELYKVLILFKNEKEEH